MKEYLGILGGMGPMASALFYKMITEKTAAEKDQDHINILLLSDAETPDRTAAILSDDFSKWQAAWDSLHEDCLTLQNLGCKAICTTCNTAHYYLHQFDDLKIPIISMIRETA
ncbi:MAG: aspartate/glutamate racemase family protein, partial [Firmicutes bacterium]|nr:aspartate/glutamate racemase family protein [Bacillota bacterium]